MMQSSEDKTVGSTSFDLAAYFNRIGFKNEAAPTLQTLVALHELHPASIPFENLNPLLKWPVLLDTVSLQQKIIGEQRGGYCFEQNLLFSHALRTIGFDVTWLSGRVIWNRPAGVVSPRTHMLLLIKLAEGAFIADVGFGGLTLTSPLQLDYDSEQKTPHESFRIIKEKEDYQLQACIRGEWKIMYTFNLQEQLLPDYEATSWYLCNYPESHFIKNLRAARSAPGLRYALNNNEFAVHQLNGATVRKTLTTAEEIMTTLENTFLIKLPPTPELKKAMEKILSENLV